jgi:flavoprotein
LKTVGCFNCPFNLVTAGKRTVVDVRELDNAKTVELTRQPSQMNLMMFYRQAERLA